MYNKNSLKAEEFISHEEILESLKYADENKDNIELIDKILSKAREAMGLIIEKLLYFSHVRFLRKTKKYISLQKRLRRSSTSTE